MLHSGRPVAVDDSQTSQWRSVERLMSLPPGWKILRNGDISWLEPEPSFEWYRRFYNEGYLSDAQNPVFPGDAKFEAKRLAYFNRRLRRIERYLGHKPDDLKLSSQFYGLNQDTRVSPGAYSYDFDVWHFVSKSIVHDLSPNFG